MSFDVRIGDMSVRSILSSPPRITDQLVSACRTLELTVRTEEYAGAYLGHRVELWRNGERWFYGFLIDRTVGHNGEETYTAYDPLWYFKKNKGDFVFKNMTLTQIFQNLCERVGVARGPMADTGAPITDLFFRAASADKVATDCTGEAMNSSGRKWWYRFDPSVDSFGCRVIERVVPDVLWAFERGINLVTAKYQETIADTYNVVTLINRETGKIVTRSDADSIASFGQMVEFEEVEKDKADQMEQIAQEKLDELSDIKITMPITAINPGNMPQFFSGDWVYVAEERTDLFGAFNIVNVTHEFVSDNLINLSMDLQYDIQLPKAKYKKNPKKDPTASKKKGTSKKATGQPVTAGNYSAEVKAVMEKYGIK